MEKKDEKKWRGIIEIKVFFGKIYGNNVYKYFKNFIFIKIYMEF